MNNEELNKALTEIERWQRAADQATNQALRLVIGRLRKGDPYYLTKLKVELRDFNITTKCWK